MKLLRTKHRQIKARISWVRIKVVKLVNPGLLLNLKKDNQMFRLKVKDAKGKANKVLRSDRVSF